MYQPRHDYFYYVPFDIFKIPKRNRQYLMHAEKVQSVD
jgi:hypothetical protein